VRPGLTLLWYIWGSFCSKRCIQSRCKLIWT